MKEYDYKHRGAKRRRHSRDNLSDLKIEIPEFDGDLNPKNYLDWVLAIERIFELKDYID